MPRVSLTGALQHEQIEFPSWVPAPEGVKRASGAVHLRRNVLRELSDAEVEYIRLHRPDVFKHMRVEPEPKMSRALRRSLEMRAAREKAAADREKAETTKRRAATVVTPGRGRRSGGSGGSGGSEGDSSGE